MSVRPQTKDKPAAASFQWDDPFLLDDQLTEDERLIRDTARAYAQDKLLPRVTKAYLEEKTDREISAAPPRVDHEMVSAAPHDIHHSVGLSDRVRDRMNKGVVTSVRRSCAISA